MLALAVCAAAAALCAAPLLGAPRAAAGPPGGQRAQAVPVRGPAHARRVGGAVRRAWPDSGRRPRTAQARWLARQVGAIAPRPCARQWRQARRRCHLGAARARPAPAPAAAMGAAGGDPGAPPGPAARIAGAVPGPAEGGPVTVSSSSPKLPLQLVRSYAIPADDPAYQRLLNWSWTYDSAVSAAAFAAGGDKDNAGQLLDQLTALQYSDGSLEIAFNTATGEGARVFRSGTVAWLGLAAATYDRAFSSNRYRDAEQRAADYLLSLQTPSGLIKGGPDVSWVSSEHNLVAYVFLARLAAELQAAGKASDAARYQAAASTLAAAINANLLVSDAAGSRFRQGLGDDTPALDVQALGAMYLQGIGQPALAAQVLAYAQATFALAGRAVSESADPATYNLTYSAPGPFSGFAPYAGPGAPDVLWAEGAGQMRLAHGRARAGHRRARQEHRRLGGHHQGPGPAAGRPEAHHRRLRVPPLARLHRRRLDGALPERPQLLRRAAPAGHGGHRLDQGARREPDHHLPRRPGRHDHRDRRRAARARRLDRRRLHRHRHRHPALRRRLRGLRPLDRRFGDQADRLLRPARPGVRTARRAPAPVRRRARIPRSRASPCPPASSGTASPTPWASP